MSGIEKCNTSMQWNIESCKEMGCWYMFCYMDYLENLLYFVKHYTQGSHKWPYTLWFHFYKISRIVKFPMSYGEIGTNKNCVWNVIDKIVLKL
jgi:hypothetical protein